MLGEEGQTRYCGSIGKDKFGYEMKSDILRSGVEPLLFEVENQPTGTCAALTNGAKRQNRSLCTNLAGSKLFSKHYLDSVWDKVSECSVFYAAAFLLTSDEGPKSLQHVAKYCAATNKVFCTNISAQFLMEVPEYKAAFDNMIPYADYIFGNEDEFISLAKAENWDYSDLSEIATKIARKPKVNKKRNRIVIVTQGANETIVATSEKIERFEVLRVKNLVDTNGAGDAFVGGFLSRVLLGRPTAECISAGHWAAGIIIQHIGCTFPSKNVYH